MSDRSFKIEVLKVLVSEEAPDPKPEIPENLEGLTDNELDIIFYKICPYLCGPAENAGSWLEFMNNTECLGKTVTFTRKA